MIRHSFFAQGNNTKHTACHVTEKSEMTSDLRPELFPVVGNWLLQYLRLNPEMVNKCIHTEQLLIIFVFVNNINIC